MRSSPLLAFWDILLSRNAFVTPLFENLQNIIGDIIMMHFTFYHVKVICGDAGRRTGIIVDEYIMGGRNP